jgi:hypothetical protein
VEDHHVDRPDVEAQQCVKLTGTNRSFGLIRSLPSHAATKASPDQEASTTTLKTLKAMALHQPYPSFALRRPGGYGEGMNTRSHPELGRENPQRQWYCVLRRGRVGRRQVFTTQRPINRPQKKRIPTHNHYPLTHPHAGWSSPVARQAHNLKVVGSNPTPATKKNPANSMSWRGFAVWIQGLAAGACPAGVRF